MYDQPATPDQAVREYAYNAGADRPDVAWIEHPAFADSWTANPYYTGPAVPHPMDDSWDDEDITMDQTAANLLAFMTAGDATFTVTSRKTGTRFTYRVEAASETGKWFVKVLTGPDNRNDYTYAGMLFEQEGGALKPVQTRNSKVKAAAPSWMGFVWLVSMLNAGRDIGEQAEVDPMGKCGRCRRELTDPESIRTGLGPVCREKALG